jgi:aminobutyraldehyde dehydrogenase
MPHGGRRRSGFGYDMSIHALDQYSVAKHILLNEDGAE